MKLGNMNTKLLNFVRCAYGDGFEKGTVECKTKNHSKGLKAHMLYKCRNYVGIGSLLKSMI
jgi:hypothetical protein